MSLVVDVIKRENGTYVVMPNGSMDSNTYGICEEKIKPFLNESTKVLIFDLSKLEYISSAGLRVIFGAKKAIDAVKGTFLLSNLQPQIRKVFDIVKALPAESIFESVEEADRYLDSMQKEEG